MPASTRTSVATGVPLAQRVFMGIAGRVVALERSTGQVLWDTKLRGSDFVNVLVDGTEIVAHTGGELFGLDVDSGTIRWRNPLKGYGYGAASLTSAAVPTDVAGLFEHLRQRARDQNTAAAQTQHNG